MRRFFTAMAALGLMVLSGDIGVGQSRPAAAPSLEGVWLAATSGMNGKVTNPKRLPGLMIQTKGYYSLIMQEGRSAPPSAPRKPLPPFKTPGKPTDAEKLAAFDIWAPLEIQTGTYEVKGGTVIRHQMVNKNAASGDISYEFRFEDNGNTLVTIGANGATNTYRRLE